MDRSKEVRKWLKISLCATALLVAALALFADSCLSFGGGQNLCRPKLPVPDVLRMAGVYYLIPGIFLAVITWTITVFIFLDHLRRKFKARNSAK